MSKLYTNLIKSRSEYTRSYGQMRGVDFSEIRKSSESFGDLCNMYVDYDGGGDAVESIPGFRKILSLGARIHGIYLQNLGGDRRFVIVHAGDALHRFNLSDRDSLQGNTPLTEFVDAPSHAFNIADKTYVMSCGRVIEIDGEGTAKRLYSEELLPHLPTTYENGEPLEERNLLCDSFRQTFSITGLDRFAFFTKKLTFSVLDRENRTCAVTGILGQFSGDLYIPAEAEINGIIYKVTEISTAAFRGNTGITSVITRNNLINIGRSAFSGCTSLRFAVLADTVKRIEYHAFYECSALKEIYVGLGFMEFISGCFDRCDALERIYYADDDLAYVGIGGIDYLPALDTVYTAKYTTERLAFRLYGDFERVDRVTVCGVETEFSYDPEYKEVSLLHSNPYALVGGEVVIDGSFGVAYPSKNAILYCTLSAVHDGRVFLSGNPDYPGYVFYSSEGEDGKLFFPESYRFADGADGCPVTSLLSSNGYLTVFKERDDGSGSIFRHTAKDEDGERSYPVSYTHGGIGAIGPSFVIYDRTVFISEGGVYALEGLGSGDGSLLISRSERINSRLLKEDRPGIRLAEWQGYLVMCAAGRIYLGDTRSRGGEGFDWYYLDGIGTYEGGERIYRYASVASEGYDVREGFADLPAEGVVMSESDENGVMRYYVEADYLKYALYRTDQFCGGSFSPACSILGIGELLFFGTESGDICLFNNDKRGVAPDHIRASADFDPAEYRTIMGDRIHPYFYSFDNRAVRYSAKTKPDDCDIPHLTKSTVRNSLVLKCKTFIDSAIDVSVATDNGVRSFIGRYFPTRISFSDLHFNRLGLTAAPYSIIPIAENRRGWVEKQIILSSEEFRKPFGICGMTYRYTIKGKIKNN